MDAKTGTLYWFFSLWKAGWGLALLAQWYEQARVIFWLWVGWEIILGKYAHYKKPWIRKDPSVHGAAIAAFVGLSKYRTSCWQKSTIIIAQSKWNWVTTESLITLSKWVTAILKNSMQSCQILKQGKVSHCLCYLMTFNVWLSLMISAVNLYCMTAIFMWPVNGEFVTLAFLY